MKLNSTEPIYDSDRATKSIWESLYAVLRDVDGICYYRHPILPWVNSIPHLTLLAKNYEPLAMTCESWTIDDIERVEARVWQIRGKAVSNPLLDLDDYRTGLQQRFDRERILRRCFRAESVLALPLISNSEFEEKFGAALSEEKVIWRDLNLEGILLPCASVLSDRQWLLAKSVFQGVNPLNKSVEEAPASAQTLGEAIAILEKDIALLDEEQHKVAIQIAPGPQRIRGLAGTGKTVVLAMKAANIHLKYPERKILFTFNTQSLYNQTKSLISKFYRTYSDSDPNWENVHVRHAWGSSRKHGVYYDITKRSEVVPLVLANAKSTDPDMPLRACSKHALQLNIQPFYDHILVDEAQDFPKEFFQVLYKLAKEEKAIYWAYDELQNLSAVELPSPTDLFGTNDKGVPLVSVDGDDYPGGIEKDFVLHRSYRCPVQVLMLAHGIGLGIHAPKGCVQMLKNRESWRSIGYQIEQGDLVKGQQTVILRPPDNSPNRIGQIYKGGRNLVEVSVFDSREEELESVVSSIVNDIKTEGVRPEHIIVISLDAPKRNFVSMQQKLYRHEIASTIPGLVDESSEFAEPGMVTLSTRYRAKGNEAPIVYIVGFDSLYEYAEEIENRNAAFSSISRAKGWVRISGAGRQMKAAKDEIDKILIDIPYFRFIFPDPDKLPRVLDASETTRRRKEVKKAREYVKALTEIDKEALGSLDPELIKQAKTILDKISDETE